MSNLKHGDSFVRATDAISKVRRFFKVRRQRVTLTGMRFGGDRQRIYLAYHPALDTLGRARKIRDLGDGTEIHGFNLGTLGVQWVRPAGGRTP